MGELIVVCQSRGKFEASKDGSLTYIGGEAHATSVTRETKFDELKSEMAEMWSYDPSSLTIKYVPPYSLKTLITVSSDKDVQCMIDIHKESKTVDVYVLANENLAPEVPPVPCSRSSDNHALKLSTTPFFQIKKLNQTHTCEAGIGRLNCSQASRMETAREELQGSYKEAYNQLPWLCEKIVEANPGSVATLITREDKSFHRLFVALHASIYGFQNGCCRMLFLESMTLKSKYHSELLTATTLDGNDGILPVAFAVVDIINDDNWHWFLVQLKLLL